MKLFNYLKKEIWRIRVEDLPKRTALKVRISRIFMLISRSFTTKQVQQGASALTYYSLLSIVPILAFLIGIAKGLLVLPYLRSWLKSMFAGQELVIEKLIDFAHISLKQGGKGVVAGIGIFIVLWSAIRILIYIEFTMNKLWEVRARRALSRKFIDYLAILGLCPALLAISVILTAYVSTVVSDIGKDKGMLEDLGPVLFPLLNFLPVALSWLFLTFLYSFVPNTYVKFRSAFYAAIISGTLYQALSWGYFYLQIGVSHYSTVYGTFAALPLFLIWVHLSWIIILMGSKIAFAFQNVKAYEFVSEEVVLSHQMILLLALRITHRCIKRFTSALSAQTSEDLSNELIIPLAVTQDLIYKLVDSGVLIAVKQEGERSTAYMPALAVDHLTIKQVIDMIEGCGESIPLAESPETEKIIQHMEEFSMLVENSDQNVLLKEIE